MIPWLPSDEQDLYKAWQQRRPLEPAPTDWCDGNHYGYSLKGDGYALRSAGLVQEIFDVDPHSGYSWLGAAATANDLSALFKPGAIK